MTRKSSARRDKSGKKEIMSVATPARSNMFAQDELLKTRHEILVENHENLKKDYANLEKRFELVEEMNELMKPHLQNQNQFKELEEKNLRLLKDIESERSEKNKYKKMVEEMKRMESESKAMVDDLRIENDELLIVIEKEEEEQKKIGDKYNELAERSGEVEKERSYLKSLYDAENIIGKGRNTVAFDDEVIVVGENLNVNNNTVADVIVISDDSDAEYDNPPRVSNIISQLPVGIKQEECNNVGIKQEECSNVGIKQEECSNGANSSQVNHPSLSSSSSSSSSSSDEEYLVKFPVKRSRNDYNKS